MRLLWQKPMQNSIFAEEETAEMLQMPQNPVHGHA
jgi:hypothetical protein